MLHLSNCLLIRKKAYENLNLWVTNIHILMIHKHMWSPCIELLSYFCPACQCKKMREFMFIYAELVSEKFGFFEMKLSQNFISSIIL